MSLYDLLRQPFAGRSLKPAISILQADLRKEQEETFAALCVALDTISQQITTTLEMSRNERPTWTEAMHQNAALHVVAQEREHAKTLAQHWTRCEQTLQALEPRYPPDW